LAGAGRVIDIQSYLLCGNNRLWMLKPKENDEFMTRKSEYAA
jgi:hypothetical protein